MCVIVLKIFKEDEMMMKDIENENLHRQAEPEHVHVEHLPGNLIRVTKGIKSVTRRKPPHPPCLSSE